MPSTYSTELKLELQATGENRSTWGTKANTVFTLLEDAIAGTSAITLSDGNYSLTTTNGAADEARNMMLRFSGTLTASRTITIPALSKMYVIYNGTTGGYDLTISNGTNTATAKNGYYTLIVTNGTAVAGHLLLGTDFSSMLTAMGAAPTASPTFTGTVNFSTGTTLVMEGATADAYETTLTAGDPTADRTITFPDASGTVLVSGADVVIDTGKVIIFEGSTADAYETTITVTDPTADNTVTIPNATGTVLLDTTDVVVGTGKSVIFEGATANAYETTLTVTDPTADQTITLPNATGTVLLDTTDVVVGTGKAIIFEGATADAYETTLTVTDPTADNTITFPNATGTVLLDTTGGITHSGAQLLNGVTSYDFTDIPSTVSVIFINLYNVNFNSGTGNALIQLGDSGGIETSGYLSDNSSPSGFVVTIGNDSYAANGLVILSRLASDGLRWVCSGGVAMNTSHVTIAGTKALTSRLDRIRLTGSGVGSFENTYVSIAYF